MVMFDKTDSESDASDVQTQSLEILEQEEHRDKITDAAKAKSNDNEPMLLIAQPEKGPTMNRDDWNGERLILEYSCGQKHKNRSFSKLR
eukprot:6047101-Pyramimonas_sp.AAC.1